MKTKMRRVLSIALALCLCLSLLPMLARPADSLTPTYEVSAAYKSTAFYTKLCAVKLTGNQRDDIINVALSQTGYYEGNYSGDTSGANDGSYNNYTEYNYWYHNHVNSGMPTGGSYAHWCATFVSWCAEQANIPTSILNRSTAAGHSASYFNIYFYAGGSTLASSSDNNYHFLGYNYTPKKGDLFYTRSWSHVGLVVSVEGSYVTTVEGNTNNDGSADGFGVFVRTRRIADLYFGAPEYVDAVHTCEEWELDGFEETHPHHSIYKCTVCGETRVDSETTNTSPTCAACQIPDKPYFTSLQTGYSDYDKVRFEWNPAANATHYNITIDAVNAQGVWELYEQINYASSGHEKTLPVGSYRCRLRAYNSNGWNADGSDWLYTDGDYSFFTVTQSYCLVTFDGNGGFSPIASQTVWNGSAIGELPIPQRYGYEFLGWYQNPDGIGEAVLPTTTIFSDVTLYACWSNFRNPTLTLNYPSLAFEDEIQYNVYFSVDYPENVVEMGLAVYPYRNTSGNVSNALEIIPGYVTNANGSYTVRSKGIPAKQLGDAFYFKIYAKLSNGTYVYSDIAGYHAVAYANSVLNDSSTSAKAKTLVVAMLNYGAAAQTYFSYKTDALMNANLTAAQKALVTPYSDTMVGEVVKPTAGKSGSFVMSGGYSAIKPSVSFEGAFAINYYFTPTATPNDGITFYYWTAEDYNKLGTLTAYNATGTMKMYASNGQYSANVSGIAAKQMDDTIYVAAVYTSGSTTYHTNVIPYSLGAYCKNVSSTTIGAATAVYGYYAKAYFA